MAGGAAIDSDLTTSIQNQLELIRQQVDNSLRVGITGDLTIPNAAIQTSIKTLQDQIQNQVNAQMSGGAAIDPALATSIQNQLELIRQQIDDSLRVGRTTDLTIPNATVQAKLELEKKNIESRFNKFAGRFAARKTRLHSGRLASAEVTRIVEGNVEVDYVKNSFKRNFKKGPFKGSVAAAFGYVPRKMSARVPAWGRKMKLYMLNLKQKVKKNQWYQNAKDPWNNIDLGANAGKAGMFALEFVDFFDEICDKVAIASIFVDGFLYDPDGTGLDWYPLSDKALDQVAQNSVKAQLEEFKIYNDSLGADEIKAKYPLIAGPLDFLENDESLIKAGKSCRDDPEYAQRRVEYEVDAVRLKMLNDPNLRVQYRQKILDAQFNGSEAELQEYIAEDELNSILDYDGLLSPADYDELYVYAFKEVCSYHLGKTYVDTYTDGDGNTGRKKPHCGWATKEDCVQKATEWINEKGQVGSYGEWFTWTQLNTIFTNLTTENTSFVAPLTTSSPLYPELINNKGICIVTGAGQHFSCKEAGGLYNSLTHRCDFNQKICQYYGTCYDATKGNCVIPKGMDQAQNFLGQYFPREWVRLNGCLVDGSTDARFKNLVGQVGNFVTNTGTFFGDISKNKKNWSAGMKTSFSDPANIAELSMIFGPGLLGMGTGPSMIIIFLVVGGMMADKALTSNREYAQRPPTVPAEYTVGGWKSNHSGEQFNFKTRSKVTRIATTVNSIDIKSDTSFYKVYITFTTDKPHGYLVGDKLYHLGFSDKINQNMFYDGSIPGQNSEFTIDTITTNTIRIKEVTTKIVGVGSPVFLDIDPTDVYVYARTPFPTPKVYEISKTYTNTKSLAGVPVTKVAVGVGFVSGWVTKPLRPRKSDEKTLVSEKEGVDQIADVQIQDFFIDVCPSADADKQIPLKGGCSENQYGWNVIASPCVNTAYTKNYNIADDYDGRSIDAAKLYKCLSSGMKSLWAFSDECKKATAVDVVTGFIESPNSTTNVGKGFEWMALQKHKRLCSERDTPMIRAWDAPHINKTWCIPERPPLSWVDSEIGQLNAIETEYARNRVWTGGVDPYSPEVHMTVVEEGGNYEVGDSAKYWYYQLVYDPELFNRGALWNDQLLSNNFSMSTIAEMRQYYCLEDFKKFYEDETLDKFDDRCWGYTSINTTNYSYTPMTNVGNNS
jgi:hypothetical protein